MFGPLGFNEIIFILVLGFLMLGPKQMALFSRTLGEVMGKLYRATADARRLFEEERRKLEEEMSDVTTPVREAKQQWGQLKGQLKKGVDGIDQEIRKERQAFNEHVEGVKADADTIDAQLADGAASNEEASKAEASKDGPSPDADEPDLSRRKFLGDFDPPEGEGDAEQAGEPEETPAPIEVRTPSGQMARGSLVEEAETDVEDGGVEDAPKTAADAPESNSNESRAVSS